MYKLNNIISILRKKNRKNLMIKIENRKVIVFAPFCFSNDQIHKVLENKKNWIDKKVKEQENYLRKKNISFENGSGFYYFGHLIHLKKIKGKEDIAFIRNNQLIVLYKKKIMKKTIELWYKKEIKKYVMKRLEFFTREIKVKYKDVSFKIYKNRLGSCSKLGSIIFNWKIVMMPKNIIDYVIVHELCHLKQFNHSLSFWSEVKLYCPEYKECIKWIKSNYNIINW